MLKLSIKNNHLMAIVQNYKFYDSQICLFSREAKNNELHPGNRWAYFAREEIIRISS